MPAPSPDAPTRSPGLQIVRGLAALGVAVFHVGYYANEVFKDGFLLGISSRLGVYGVTAFFCISGYLMAGLCREQKPGPFILHRIFRIYPTYLLVVALVLADHLVRTGSLGPLADLGWKRALKRPMSARLRSAAST